LSAKGKTTSSNDFSFLELGYCPIVLPLGCHEYEEDVNKNDSLETSVNDEDCVFRNTLMVVLLFLTVYIAVQRIYFLIVLLFLTVYIAVQRIYFLIV
jgi:hypothetical protein